MKRLNMAGIRPSGVRKLETSFTKSRYHPHFHIYIESREMAERVKEEWLKEWPYATKRAQDIRPAEGLQELFKYCFEILPKHGKQVNHLAMDTIFRAMKGTRIFQPFGKVKKATEEEIEELISEEIEGQPLRNAIFTWLKNAYDWVDLDTGEMLSHYTPTKRDKKMMKQLKNGEDA